MAVLEWSEVEAAADSAFRVWVGNGDLLWAKEAWGVLGRMGLTTYSDSSERSKVAVRFLALADFYLDFCSLAFEEGTDPDISVWAEELEISDFEIGRMAERAGLEIDCDSEDKPVEQALKQLAEAGRREIVSALEGGLGGRDGLFVSLWRSPGSPDRYNPSEEGDEEPQEEDQDWREDQERAEKERPQKRAGAEEPQGLSDGEILNSNLTALKLCAWEWLSEGASPLGCRSGLGEADF